MVDMCASVVGREGGPVTEHFITFDSLTPTSKYTCKSYTCIFLLAVQCASGGYIRQPRLLRTWGWVHKPCMSALVEISYSTTYQAWTQGDVKKKEEEKEGKGGEGERKRGRYC